MGQEIQTLTHLLGKLEIVIQSKDKTSQERIRTALALMQEIHDGLSPRPDGTRIEHILRVTLQMIAFGEQSTNSIIKALLHDSVEEVPEKLSDKYVAKHFKSFIPHKSTAQFFALEYIDDVFGSDVATGVSKLTIPRHAVLAERHRLYVEHVKELLEKSPAEALIKLADFYDNGLNVYSIEDEAFRKAMCSRYLPLFDFFIEAIKTSRIVLAPDKKKNILEILEASKTYVEMELL